MTNIFCRDSNLSSWCTRLLIERYAAGDTASEAKTFIETGHLEPAHDGMEEIVNQLMQEGSTSYDAIQAFCRSKAELFPPFWKEIRISRQTVNRYFLLFGAYFWEKAAGPEYRRHAERNAKFMFEFHREAFAGSTVEDEVETWIERTTQSYVKWVNGVLPKDMGRNIAGAEVIPYLTERSKKYNGLSLKHAKEHIAWAFVVAGNIEKFGVDDRKMLAAILALMLQNDPL